MKYLIAILFSLYTWVSFSQVDGTIDDGQFIQQKQITFRDITVEDGLSQNSVVSIAQDSIGYLWFATQDGLNRYDGKTFKYYNKQFADITRPTFSKLGKVYVDRHGSIWVIPISGRLEKYNVVTDSFTVVSKIQDVSAIHQSARGDFYIGTFGKGLFKINSETSDTIQVLKPQDKTTDVYGFHSNTQHTYALTSKGVIQIGNTDSYSSLKPGNQNIGSAVTRGEDLWFGSYGGGLYKTSKSSDTLVKFKGFNAKNTLSEVLNIQSLLVDQRDRLWVATYGDGLYLIDFKLKTIRHFTAQKTNPFALHYNDVLSLFEDFTGTIWFGTDGAGLSYYDENLSKFNILTNNQTPKDVSVDVVRAISVGKNKTIWLGTSGKGLTSYNSTTETYKTYTTSNSKISSDRIMSLLYVDQELWVGFQGNGLNILNGLNNFKSYKALEDYTIWKIYKDSADRVWLCTRDNGLIQFDKTRGIVQQFNVFNSQGDLSTNNIRTIEEGKNVLWIGTESEGLFMLNIEANTISKVEAIPNKIKSLYYDANEMLWIGTNGEGLIAYHTTDKTVKHFNRDNGLPNNVLYSILPADDGNNLWLSSNRGITKFDLANENITNYNNYDGLQALEFNTGAYFKDNDGYLYFGGLEGLNWFKPEQLTKNPIPPKTVITNFKVFDEDHERVPNSKLNHNQNTVTFNFAGLHYSLPERNNYMYQLVNYDDTWVVSGNNNKVNYAKLEPNTYTFKVKSSNYDNVWDEEPATFTFSVLEPWYFNTLAKVIYGLLLLLSAFGIYKYLKWRWYMKMQLQFEHNETERLKKLDEFKSRLYTNISHEFRTPLTLISGPIEKQLAKPELNREDKTDFSLIQRNSKRLLNLVNQLLDLSKLESGSLKLNVSQGNLSILLKQICAAFEFKAQEKDIAFSYNIVDVQNAWYDRDVIEKIVTNLLANAIKYAPEHGKINFETTLQDGQIVMAVINNGNTITDEELGRLFQRFYQADKKSDGAGIGLSLVKELCILSHGNIVANTMNEDDIQFTVTLPVERSYYNQSEIDFEKQLVSEPSEKHAEAVPLDLSDGQHVSQEHPVLLIIEDDNDVRQFVKSIFKTDYTVLEAIHGKQGIEKAIKHVPDLVISDIMMPVADGIEVCNTLKHDERTSHIPIILLTAKVGEENEIVGLKTGADAYVTKPFNSDKLKVRVEKLIQLRRQLQQHYSTSLEINPKAIATSSVDQQFLKRLQDVLDDNITSPDFTAEEFGDKMLMSRMQLHRKLKALTGLSTSVFLRSQRLKLAVALLKESDYTVSEIAYEVGFNTPSYFIKCFKEEFKCTPNEYTLKS